MQGSRSAILKVMIGMLQLTTLALLEIFCVQKAYAADVALIKTLHFQGREIKNDIILGWTPSPLAEFIEDENRLNTLKAIKKSYKLGKPPQKGHVKTIEEIARLMQTLVDSHFQSKTMDLTGRLVIDIDEEEKHLPMSFVVLAVPKGSLGTKVVWSLAPAQKPGTPSLRIVGRNLQTAVVTDGVLVEFPAPGKLRERPLRSDDVPHHGRR